MKSGKSFPWAIPFLILLAAYSFTDVFTQGNWWREKVIAWDVHEYYQYLPPAFIHNDPSFDFLTKIPQEEAQRYWLHMTPTGNRMGRMSLGMAIVYTPAFMIAHNLAPAMGYPANGWSGPYHLAVVLTGWLMSISGLIFLYRLLTRHFHFRDGPVLLTLAALFLATNLFFYTTTEGGMTHATSFGLFSMFLYFCVRWHENPRLKWAFWLALAGGMIILVRPTNIIIWLIFFLYGLAGIQSLKVIVRKFWRYKLHLFFMLGVLIVIAMPQLIYWKVQTGSWVYYSYTKEGFFFNDPEIWKGLFSARKGWLIYSPVMILGLIGLVWLRRYAKPLMVILLIFLVLHWYITFSWWCWWYGGGYGMRALIESQALLAIPLAALFTEALKNKIAHGAVALFLFFCITYSHFQTLQYRASMLHWDSMTWPILKRTFFNPKPIADPEKEAILDAPDYEAALEGKE